MKRILIINGHPNKDSFNFALSEAYAEGAMESGNAEIKFLNINELNFDVNLAYGYKKRTELEADLLDAQELLRWSDHVVVTFPTWFGSTPAILKGFFDRTFLPEFAFRYHEKGVFWDKLLLGRTGRVLVTMDMPPIYYFFRHGSPGNRAIKGLTLDFVGIKTKVSSFGRIQDSSDKQREKWLLRAKKLGRKDAMSKMKGQKVEPGILTDKSGKVQRSLSYN
ncbi:MAG: NAD(P)H-dependent oxidoreductase [Bacteroidota bacterium]